MSVTCGSVAKPGSMLIVTIFNPWERSLFSNQGTAGKEHLLAGNSLHVHIYITAIQSIRAQSIEIVDDLLCHKPPILR